MEPNIDVLATLEAKSRQTSIEDLARRGKKNVRVIRAADVAWMVKEAVERAMEASEWIPPEQVEELRVKAEEEFRELRAEHVEEQRLALEREQTLSRLMQEREEQRRAYEELQREHESLRAAVGDPRGERGATSSGRPAELGTALQRVEELENEGEDLRKKVVDLESVLEELKQGANTEAAPASGDTASALLMMKMMDELQTLRSQVQGAPEASPQDGSAVESVLNEKLEKIVGSLDERLEKLGKKMGVTDAVDTSEVSFEGLVSRAVDAGEGLESNIDTVEVEKREGSGIAANLERIRKLRGGG